MCYRNFWWWLHAFDFENGFYKETFPCHQCSVFYGWHRPTVGPSWLMTSRHHSSLAAKVDGHCRACSLLCVTGNRTLRTQDTSALLWLVRTVRTLRYYVRKCLTPRTKVSRPKVQSVSPNFIKLCWAFLCLLSARTSSEPYIGLFKLHQIFAAC